MSVSCYFFVEVQDADGKWHLAKWYTDERFEEFDETGAVYSFEGETSIGGIKHIVKREKWTGLQLRDELSWSRGWGENDAAVDGLPKDVSDELAAITKNYSGVLTASRRELYADGNYVLDFANQCHYISLTDLWKMCDNKQEQWKKGLLERIRNKQLDEINGKLADLKKLVQGKTIKEKKKKDEEEYYEDSVEYYLGEYLDEIIQLRMEVGALSEIAENFTGDRWMSPEKVRIIFHFE